VNGRLYALKNQDTQVAIFLLCFVAAFTIFVSRASLLRGRFFLYNTNYLLMGKTFTNTLFAFLLLLGACNPLEEINSNGINITGDFTGRLSQIIRFGNDGQNSFYELSSIADSSSIGYPAFYLRLTEQTGTLEVRSRQEEPLRYYYIVNHGINVSLFRNIEIRERQFFRGSGIANNEITDKDDTQTLILNGRLQ
jgi:hypothetical protein